MDGITQALIQVIATNPWLAPFAALLGGLTTAANPCVLAMVPLMVAYVAGQETRSTGRSFLLSLSFSIGITGMFTILFLVTWFASSFLRAEWWTYLASAVCMLMGLHLVGILSFEIPTPKVISPRHKGLLGAFLLGLLFGLVSLPCAGPILLALLALVPLKGVGFGGVLLVSYGIGHCGLILIGGTSMGLVQQMVDSKGWSKGMAFIRKGAGIIIFLVGFGLLFA
jgi:cytochrome c biogenesis protein CcdA